VVACILDTSFCLQYTTRIDKTRRTFGYIIYQFRHGKIFNKGIIKGHDELKVLPEENEIKV
jgi:hypothetical protein